jgi:Tfp pilus assembly pilus retraction ATPase PilT
MAVGRAQGMITLDDALARLVKSGRIDRDEAARRASHPDEFESFLR